MYVGFRFNLLLLLLVVLLLVSGYGCDRPFADDEEIAADDVDGCDSARRVAFRCDELSGLSKPRFLLYLL